MLVVAALGGNALLQRGQAPEAAVQQDNVRRAVASLATIARDHRLVITHGNGPQVGMLALQSEQDPTLDRPYPLDVLGAQSDGMIGYWIARELRSTVPHLEIVTLLTQTLVYADDPAFAEPVKFVGQVYDEQRAQELATQHGWVMKPDGPGWRRVVPSPKPHRFVEISVIRRLVESGVIVVCAGGGGIPVTRGSDGRLAGVEAVVDKDLSTALLARRIDADAVLFLTDVARVQADFGTPQARDLPLLTTAEARAMPFPAGSMGPKVAAAREFVEATGGFAAIGALPDAAAILDGRAGTRIVPPTPGFALGRPQEPGVRSDGG